MSASVSSATVSSPSSDLDKRLDNLQDEWSTRFARIEALITIKSKTDAVFSPVKAWLLVFPRRHFFTLPFLAGPVRIRSRKVNKTFG